MADEQTTSDFIVGRIIEAFDRDATAGSFLREDGDGGFAGGIYRMAREIDRLCAEARSAYARCREDAAKVAERWLESSWQDEVFAARSIADAIRALPDPEASDDR